MRLDPASAALALTAGVAAVRAFRRKDARSAVIASAALLVWVAYDRRHDGLWPFRGARRA